MENEASPPVVQTSVFGKMLNIVASPGEVFDELKSQTPKTANWLVPLVLFVVTGLAVVIISFSLPSIQQQMKDFMELELEKAVAEKRMTQEQMDQTLSAGGGTTMMAIFGTIGILFNTVAGVFWSGLIAWLIGRFALKIPMPYARGLEIASLSTIILSIGFVTGLFLAMIMGDMWARPAPSVLLGKFDLHNKMHVAMAGLNLFYLWSTAIMALGLARIGGISFAKAAVWMFGYWILIRAVLIAINMGQMVL